MSFRPDERVAPKVIANVGSEVSRKVIAAHIICAAGDAVTVELGVEPQVLAADSGHYIPAEFLAELASVDSVEIIEDRTIGSFCEKGGTAFRIESPTCPPRDLAAEPNVVLQDEEAAKAGIQSSAHGRKDIAVTVC